MRLGQYTRIDAERPWAGVLNDDRVIDLPEAGVAAGIDLPRLTVDLLGEWEWERKVALVTAYARENDVGIYDRTDLKQFAPVTDPRKVIGVGLNYQDHAAESGADPPAEPVLFAKFPNSIVGPDERIAWNPALTETVDYEAELCVVIGRQAREIDESEAIEYVAGYAPGNDVSARDLQFGDEQWVRGKSLDTFAPLGPELVTTDEIDDVHDLAIWAELDGERLQDSTTANLIFGVEELVSFCSRAFTLEPGDVIYTGTPPGVGIFREPSVLLEEGSEITIGIKDLGELTNRCTYR